MITKELHTESWTVKRTAAIDEITEDDGAIKWRVEVWDGERSPFVIRYFNTREAAHHFLARMKKQVDEDR